MERPHSKFRVFRLLHRPACSLLNFGCTSEFRAEWRFSYPPFERLQRLPLRVMGPGFGRWRSCPVVSFGRGPLFCVFHNSVTFGGISSRTTCESVADSARGWCGPLSVGIVAGIPQLDICLAVAPRRVCEQSALCEDRRGLLCDLQFRQPHPRLPPPADRHRSRECSARLLANPPPSPAV